MQETARLKELISRHAREGLTPTALPGVSLLRATTTSETLGGRVFRHGAGQFAIVPVELPVTGHIIQASPAAPLLAFVLMLRQEKIAALLAEMSRATAAPPRAPAAMPAGIAVHDASPALLDGITRLLGLLDEPGAAAMLASGVKREILWRLLTGPQGATVRQIGLADSRLAHVARAIRWIRVHYDETLRVEELAALATMSASSFHRHFRAVTSMTPIQYQKQIRLHEARARLLA